MKAATGQLEEVETQVISGLADGDIDRAATALIEGYGPQVRCYLRAIIRDEAEAADAFARFAESAWQGLPSWQGRSSVRAWAYRVAWHAASRSFRDPWYRKRQPLPESAASKLAASVRSSTGDGCGCRLDGLEALRALLTLEEQSLLVLRVDRELPWHEVAVAMGAREDATGQAALRKRFERLKEKLASGAHAQGMI